MNPETEKWLQEVRARLAANYPSTASNVHRDYHEKHCVWPEEISECSECQQEHEDAQFGRERSMIADLRRFDALVTEQAEEIERLQLKINEDRGKVVCSYCGEITKLPDDITDDQRRKFLLDHILVCPERLELKITTDALARLKAKDDEIETRKRDEAEFDELLAAWEARLWAASGKIKGSPDLGMETIVQVIERKLESLRSEANRAVEVIKRRRDEWRQKAEDGDNANYTFYRGQEYGAAEILTELKGEG